MWVFLAFKRLSHFYIKYACKAHREQFSLRWVTGFPLQLWFCRQTFSLIFPCSSALFIDHYVIFLMRGDIIIHRLLGIFTRSPPTSLSVSCQNCHNFIDLIIIIQRSENIFPGYINLSIPLSFYLLGHRLLSLLKTLIIIHYGYKTEGLAEGVVEMFNERRSKSL